MTDYHDMDATVTALRSELEHLPGAPAQKLMSPLHRQGHLDAGIPSGARPGATVLLLYPQDGIPHVVLTKRSQTVEHHKGQISMPGGMVEEGESLEEAALREAHEEIGVAPHQVTLLGPLSPLFIPVSGFAMHPFVGTMAGPMAWEPALHEVESVLTPPLAELVDPGNHQSEERMILGRPREVPYFALSREKVWGATAMVLAEFLSLLGYPPKVNSPS